MSSRVTAGLVCGLVLGAGCGARTDSPAPQTDAGPFVDAGAAIDAGMRVDAGPGPDAGPVVTVGGVPGGRAGVGTTVAGCQIFPNDNAWNVEVDGPQVRVVHTYDAQLPQTTH